MRPPDFLILGAMKAGTTTLYNDLAKHPKIFLSDPKEPQDLTDDFVLSPAGRTRYFKLFSGATSAQICGEASTAYTRSHDYGTAAHRALEVCGNNLKLIYLIRDPVERAISHYQYNFLHGSAEPSVERALLQNHSYAATSDYWNELQNWRRNYNDDSILLINFHDYMANRKSLYNSIIEFLGVTGEYVSVNNDGTFNAADDVLVANGILRRLQRSKFFQRQIKPRLNRSSINLIKSALLNKPLMPTTIEISSNTHREFLSRLSIKTHEICKARGVRTLSSFEYNAP